MEYHATEIKNTASNSKEMWKTLNNILNVNKKERSTDPTKIEFKGKVIEEVEDIANIFNKHYINIKNTVINKMEEIKEISKGNEGKEKGKISKEVRTEWEEFDEVDRREVRKTINSLKVNAAAGIDQIPARLIKDNCDTLLTPITHLVSMSLKKGEFPNIYKEAVIRPIYKGGRKEDISNYRPISLMSNISKIIEKIVKSQIYSYLEDTNFFDENQLGFRQNKGTEDAINKLHTTVSGYLDEGKHCLVVLQDLSKAFDLVDHKILINKIEQAGCQGKILGWCKSYLDKRKQKVRVHQTFSSTKEIKSGVPQGTNDIGHKGRNNFICRRYSNIGKRRELGGNKEKH